MPSNNEINKFPYDREIVIRLDVEKKNASIIDSIRNLLFYSHRFNLIFFYLSPNDNNIKKITRKEFVP